MAYYGITLTQLAKYTSMISDVRNEEFTAINQVGFYKRFCAAQDFEELLGEDITSTNIEAIDYTEWKMKIHEVHRSSTPLFGSRDTELLVVLFQKENAALLMLMGHALMDEKAFIDMETIAYNAWEMVVHDVQRSSTPLLGLRESKELFVQFEKEDTALLMLMGQGLTREKASFHMNNTIEATDYNEWEMRMNDVQRPSTPLCGLPESQVLVVSFEKEDAALFMLMGHRIIESDY